MGLKKLAALVVALGLAGYAAVLFMLGPKVEVLEAVKREVVQSVVATGRIESPFRVDLGAQVVGILDTYDGLTAGRFGREALEPENAIWRIVERRSQWAPRVLDAFLKIAK